jgi:hypothetical protein
VRWVVAAVAALLLAALTASSAVAATPDRGALARMDRVIQYGMERSGVPGFAVAVVSKLRLMSLETMLTRLCGVPARRCACLRRSQATDGAAADREPAMNRLALSREGDSAASAVP